MAAPSWTPPVASPLFNPCPGAPGITNGMPTNACVVAGIVELDRLIIALLQGVKIPNDRMDPTEKELTKTEHFPAAESRHEHYGNPAVGEAQPALDIPTQSRNETNPTPAFLCNNPRRRRPAFSTSLTETYY